jgi:cellulose synthase/poly-beta-1,6-N-acetylglucosamine synthase-like glycosyltransferase
MLYRLNLYDFALVGFTQLFLASALFLSPARRFRGYRRGRGSRVSEVFLNSLSALVIAVISCWLVSVIWGIPVTTLELPGIVVALIAAVVIVARPDCNIVGQIFSAAFFAAGLGLILFTLKLTITYANGGFELLASGFFVVLSICAVMLWNSYVISTSDVLCRFRHSRPLPEADPSYKPFVSLHIAAYNEPPEMLMETIRRAEAIDYPNFEIIVLDNNTKDPAVWQPIEAYCRDRPRVTFVHVDPWPGFKAGALNLALREYTDERAEIIGLIDADDFVVPHYLKETAPYFADERIGYLQSFEGNRDFEGSPYYTACVDSYQAFYLTNMSSRNERDAVPFVGTMGLFRRSALEQAGGWNEWCICEDTEASVRVLKLGWSGLYIPRCFGKGVVPPSYAGLATQRYRWCFGGMQILRLHWRSLMPWDRSPDNRLSNRQRRDFLMASLGWTRDLLMVLFTTALLITTGLLLSGSSFWIEPIAGGVSLAGICLIVVASLSMLWVLRQWTNMTRRRAFFSLVISLASSWTIAIACIQGLVQREGVFLRTPKNDRNQKVVQRMGDALWLARWEMVLVALLIVCAGLLAASHSAHILLIVVICLQACVFFCAPVAAFWNVRAQAVPAAERSRRFDAEELRRSLSHRRRRSFVGAGVALAMVAVIGAVVLASVTAPGVLLAGGTAARVVTAASVTGPPTGAPALAPPFVDVTGSPAGGWLEVTAQGVVWAGGGANYFGDLTRRPGAQPINVSNIVQVRPTLDGYGYWLVASDGSVYSFGDAPYFGSLSGLGTHANDIVGLVPFSSGAGYEIVSAFEQIWTFGHGKP